ncbi:RBBP9/YdeN family alpha/beta hydrolase [Streptomyces sp. NPDC003327]
MTTYLILHGFKNHRPPTHWQHWLTERLRERGHEVRYPQLPSPDAPVLAEWLDALEEHGKRPAEGEFVVLAHSLSTLLWLQAGDRRPDADRTMLVAPPSPAWTASVPEIAEFARGLDLTQSGLKARLVYADEDPFCEDGADTHYGIPLGLDMDLVPGGVHLNPDAGYGPWESVLEWCENPEARVRTNR